MVGAIRIPRFFQHPILDVRFGFALMKDGRVPLRSKLMAVLLGAGVTALVEGFEVPVEVVFAALLPILGAAGDVVMDGAEAVAGPILMGTLLLPYLAPRDVVERIRAERATSSAGKGKSPIIDV